MRVCAPTLSIWVRRAVVPYAIGAAQAELHALGDVGGGPVGRAVLDRRRKRARKIADRVALAPPDMALVDVGVDVDEERQHDAPGHCDFRRVAEIDGAGRDDLRDRALVDEDVDDREAVEVDRSHGRRQRAAEHARSPQRIASGAGQGERRGRRRFLSLRARRRSVCERFLPIVHAKNSAPLISGAGRGRRLCSQIAAYRPSCNRYPA